MTVSVGDEFEYYTVAGLVTVCVMGAAAELPAAALRPRSKTNSKRSICGRRSTHINCHISWRGHYRQPRSSNYNNERTNGRHGGACGTPGAICLFSARDLFDGFGDDAKRLRVVNREATRIQDRNRAVRLMAASG